MLACFSTEENSDLVKYVLKLDCKKLTKMPVIQLSFYVEFLCSSE